MADAPETVNDLRRDLKRALAIMNERRADYVLGRDFYDGSRVEVAASKYVTKIINENADAFPISLAHIPVDVIVDMLELTSLEVNNDAAASRILSTVAEANDIDESAEDWVRKAAYFGDYYVIIDAAEETASGSIVAESVRWIGSSPLTTVAVYDSHDERVALYHAKVWQDGKKWLGRLYYDDCTVKLTTPKSDAPDPKLFELDFEDDPEEAYVFHPGGKALVRHLAIDGHPYGTPLHRKAWGPQDAITKVSASGLANVEAIALPSRWALLDPLAEIDDDIDDDFGTDGPDTDQTGATADGMTKATRGSKVRSIPGGIAYLNGIKQVGTFEAGDGDIFLTYQEWYLRVMAVATGIPIFEFDLKGDQPSGESRRRAMQRALKKAKRVRRAEGSFLTGIAEVTLALLGLEGRTAAATFYPIETSTDKEGIELVGLKVMNGVPVRVALLEAGYTTDQVDEWWPEDTPAVTIEMLSILGSALASLGTAKTLGVISEREVADMLPTILTTARDEGPMPGGAGAEVEDDRDGVVVNPAVIVKAKADALGSLIRAGADSDEAALLVGLEGISFPNVPTTIRIPEADAAQLEVA